MKNCSECKHFRPARNVSNLFGLVKDADFYNKAFCGLTLPDGKVFPCSTYRHPSNVGELSDRYPCNFDGKGWEKA